LKPFSITKKRYFYFWHDFFVLVTDLLALNYEASTSDIFIFCDLFRT